MSAAEFPFTPEPLLRLALDTGAFAADWAHCDLAANYLAQIVSHDREDSFRYANLLSTVLNELFEIVFARHRPGTALTCTLLRHQARDWIVLRIPVELETSAYYVRSVAATRGADLAEIYTRSLLAREPLDQALGLLELASDYGASVSLASDESAGHVTLTIDVTLEQDASVVAVR